MATLRELIIKISANSSSFQSEITRASRMGADYYRTMENGGRQAAAASRQSQRALGDLNGQLASVTSTAKGMVGAFAGAFATGNLINLADRYNSLIARVKLATTSAEDFSDAQKGLMRISQYTGSTFESNASLFSRASSSLREYGYSTKDILALTDALATGLQVSGASADDTASLITQLSQALGRGVLRGQDFNSVAQSGGRIMKALSAGLGVAQKDLKSLADAGELTTPKIVPALISQLGQLRKEFETMPNSVSAASNRITNAFQEWVGGKNNAAGITKSLSGAMDGLAANINDVATVMGALVSVGVARYFGGVASGATSATAGLISAARSEIALAEAQVRGTQISTARARAAVYRAQQALIAARNTDGQALAERRLGAAQVLLTRNIATRTAAQVALNSVTSVGSRLLTGMTSIVGGIPGLVLLGAGAWYAMYQNQEQARQSAQNYARTIDEIRSKASSMSLPETSDNELKTQQALAEQSRQVDEQAEKVRKLKVEIEGFQKIMANPGPVIGGYMINHLKSMTDVTNGLGESTNTLAVEQERLSQMQAKSQDIQQALESLENRRVTLIRQQAAEQNSAYQSLLMMNGQHSEFNRLLSLGNNLLSARQGLGSIPMRIPDAQLNTNQQNLLDKSRQAVELSKLKGEAQARKQAEYAADSAGLTSTPEFATARSEYISNEVTRYRNDQSNKPKKKGPKTDEDKAADAYKRLVENQKEEIALAGQSTELAKAKYQITEGEFSILSDVQKTELLRNATALDHIKTQEKFKALQQDLLTPEEELLQKTRERVKLLKEAAPATEDYRKTMERISKESVQEAPKFSGIDASVGGASGELGKVADAEKELKKWHKTQLDMQKELLDEKTINEETYANRIAEINKTNATQLTDIQAGYTSASLGMFADLAGQSASLLQGIGQEGSAAYKALFIASKAAAIAQAIVNTEVAATKAMAEGGLILGMPAATAIRAVGYASVALIAGQTIAGMAHDGIDRVPETGTWLLQRGERVVTAQTSAKLDSTLERVQQQKQEDRELVAGGFNYSPTIQVNGDPDDRTMLMLESAVKKGAQQGYQMVTNHLATGRGDVSKAFQTGWTAKRRAG